MYVCVHVSCRCNHLLLEKYLQKLKSFVEVERGSGMSQFDFGVDSEGLRSRVSESS